MRVRRSTELIQAWLTRDVGVFYFTCMDRNGVQPAVCYDNKHTSETNTSKKRVGHLLIRCFNGVKTKV